MKLSSPKFENNDYFPTKYSCDGDGINPPLEISGIPSGAKLLALVVDDPDAPSGDFVHWIISNFKLTEKISEGSTPPGAVRGENSSGSLEFVAPCPPSGTHRYYFKLYALSGELDLEEGFSKAQFEKEVANKLVDVAELVGLYKRGS